MIRETLSCLLIFLLLFAGGLIDRNTHAQAAEATGAAGGNAGTAACDFTAVKNSLFSTESQSSGAYSAVNSRTGAAGKYQFMPGTRASYLRNHPECNGQNCTTTAQWISSACYQVQECIMDAFTADNLAAIRKDPACQTLLANGGQTITGSGQGSTKTCQVTESGLLAAFHLGGRDECRKILANGHGDNDGAGGKGGTDTAYYTCKHGGLAVPGSCTPSPSNTSTLPGVGIAGGTGTQAQADFSGTNLQGPEDPLRDWWDAALMLMAEQFTSTMQAQVQSIGQMLDAKHQLESQRLFQQKQAEAHKDYQPSEEVCTFGTFARDLASTEHTADVTRKAVAQKMIQRELLSNQGAGQTNTADSLSHIAQFRAHFCDPNDNSGGLALLCPNPPAGDMRDRDINYTQSLDQPLSLDINMTDQTITPDEQTVFALVDNLFAHEPLPVVPQASLDKRKFQYHYMNLRSIAAMRGIARNSIANIIALKTATPNTTDDKTNAPYLRALLREFGLKDDEIKEMLGPNPSYYAQMEFLTKKIYQNPVFYTNLYDKPTNVKRIRAAMTAVKLMQDRDIQAALHRREMLMSMMLELRLREHAEQVYNNAHNSMFNDDIGGAGANTNTDVNKSAGYNFFNLFLQGWANPFDN